VKPWRNWLAAILLVGVALGGWVVPLLLESRPPKKAVAQVDPLARAEPMMRQELGALLKFQRRAGIEHPHWKTALGNYRRLLHDMGKSDAEIETAVDRLLRSPLSSSL
jgi:esterase/lipase